ncbi:MAG: twin-arginine translocase TatA/TatE family subunit [Actinomycetaceae bacterium]|nr:twin-arginine translocase TatA/TatE family subunit [Actinomycetaceae bacterium]
MKPSHIIVLVVVLIVIFGAAKLPDIAKSIGQSAKVFKKEMKELTDDVPPEGEENSETEATEAEEK